MEYANVVWGGAYDTQICTLEKVHVDGMRLVSGATAKCNITRLYDDVSWLSIRDRCENAMLTMFFKMKRDQTPSYLTQLIPKEIKETTVYNLRNNNDIKIPFTRLDSFRRSFLPTAVKLCNRLDTKIRAIPSLSKFKSDAIKKPEVNVLYYYGQRWAAIHHARIRIGCSKLKHHLCCKLHVIDDPSCICGSRYETPYHFFIECKEYKDLRVHLKSTIETYTKFIIATIMHGDRQLSLHDNKAIFDAVHLFITESRRFCD